MRLLQPLKLARCACCGRNLKIIGAVLPGQIDADVQWGAKQSTIRHFVVFGPEGTRPRLRVHLALHECGDGHNVGATDGSPAGRRPVLSVAEANVRAGGSVTLFGIWSKVQVATEHVLTLEGHSAGQVIASRSACSAASQRQE